MSSSTNSIGRTGESIASTHLIGLGFKILERNWRFKKYEIDIIADYQDFIVFIEVKTRKDDSHGQPQDFVTRKKQRFLIKAANEYLTMNNIDRECRFDIIAVTNGAEGSKIEHIPNAFYPLL
jgi:putative endonuclease